MHKVIWALAVMLMAVSVIGMAGCTQHAMSVDAKPQTDTDRPPSHGP